MVPRVSEAGQPSERSGEATKTVHATGSKWNPQYKGKKQKVSQIEEQNKNEHSSLVCRLSVSIITMTPDEEVHNTTSPRADSGTSLHIHHTLVV